MFINNLTNIINKQVLDSKYYMCNSEEAKKLLLNGFSPVSVDGCEYYIFYKTELLMEFLQKGEIK